MALLKIKKAIILAGGRGERLQPIVPDVPKPMAPVAGRPFLEFVLDRLVDAGLTEVILSVGYRAEMIQSHFGLSYRTIDLRYSVEKHPLGTGGAIALALKEEQSSAVLVLNGDTLVGVDFKALAAWSGTLDSLVGVVLCQVPDVSRYGAVILSGDRIVAFQEKGMAGPGLVNAGIYVIQPRIFSIVELGNKFSFEIDLLKRYCSTFQPQSFITNGYFIDIGTPADYLRAQEELQTKRMKE